MPDLSAEDLYAFLNGIERPKRDPVVNGMIDARDSGVRALGTDAGFALGRGVQKGAFDESERAHQERLALARLVAKPVDPMKNMVESGAYHQQTADARKMTSAPIDDFEPSTGPSGLTAADLAANKRLGKTFAPHPLTADELQKYVGEEDDGDSLLRATGALNPDRLNTAPSPEMQHRDEEVAGVHAFFSPDAEARRARVPQYWNSPAGKARLAEMEKRRKDLESRKQDFAALNRK